MLSLLEIARAVGGKIRGNRVYAPGPGHSGRDLSMSIRLADTKDGFVVTSFAGDDWAVCRDHVAAQLGLPSDYWRRTRELDPAEMQRRAEARRRAEAQERAETARLQRRALGMWREAIDPADTPVPSYLRSRGLNLPPQIAGDVIRYHPRCPWGEGTAPAMVALIRAVHTGEPIGIHRTAFDQSGAKIGRKVFGSAAAGAIMLDDFADVGSGLTVGEGVETCLAARQLGLAPVWALISVGNIGALPVLAGVEALTVLGEVDTAPNRPSATAFERVAARWHAEARAVDLVMPRVGRDMNDVILGREAA
ncbi:DUF7146 domain-containing protein [Methylobacterium longum]|uniref:Toprim domain-containing protein n=1 Tax=Methylobacterium longum TaxID=767694 RepID=A0ABT8ALU5_9HYPH|nr:toprim domain-containing protein [Methylobacterium longum]MDN3570253.1 toprim domain-containing protein [Methylobacterium longum]